MARLPKALSEVMDEKEAEDTSVAEEAEKSSEQASGEVAVDALMEDVHGHDGTQLTEAEETVEETGEYLLAGLRCYVDIGLLSEGRHTRKKPSINFNAKKDSNSFAWDWGAGSKKPQGGEILRLSGVCCIKLLQATQVNSRV